jgi:hypothetical protein
VGKICEIEIVRGEAFEHLHFKISPAFVIATLALFLACTGGAYAAGSLISGVKIKKHTIAENRLTKKAVRELRGHTGKTGKAGLQGVPGQVGQAGPAGPTGATGAGVANSIMENGTASIVSIAGSTTYFGGTAYAFCPAGDPVLGGGATTNTGGDFVSSSYPYSSASNTVDGTAPTGWVAQVAGPYGGDSDEEVTAYVVCGTS